MVMANDLIDGIKNLPMKPINFMINISRTIKKRKV